MTYSDNRGASICARDAKIEIFYEESGDSLPDIDSHPDFLPNLETTTPNTLSPKACEGDSDCSDNSSDVSLSEREERHRFERHKVKHYNHQKTVAEMSGEFMPLKKKKRRSIPKTTPPRNNEIDSEEESMYHFYTNNLNGLDVNLSVEVETENQSSEQLESGIQGETDSLHQKLSASGSDTTPASKYIRVRPMEELEKPEHPTIRSQLSSEL